MIHAGGFLMGDINVIHPLKLQMSIFLYDLCGLLLVAAEGLFFCRAASSFLVCLHFWGPWAFSWPLEEIVPWAPEALICLASQFLPPEAPWVVWYMQNREEPDCWVSSVPFLPLVIFPSEFSDSKTTSFLVILSLRLFISVSVSISYLEVCHKFQIFL